MKTYSAQSGYVYQYYFVGHRGFHAHGETGLEFVFEISADRKGWSSVAVHVSDAAVGVWEEANGRQLNSTERYAIAKLALFQAFDERPTPAQMKTDVNVRHADLKAILDMLEL